jgi:hypothetical protein
MEYCCGAALSSLHGARRIKNINIFAADIRFM